MRTTHPDSDLGDPPAGYFWSLNLATHLLATLKGVGRRQYVRALIDESSLDELEDYLDGTRPLRDPTAVEGRQHSTAGMRDFLPVSPSRSSWRSRNHTGRCQARAAEAHHA